RHLRREVPSAQRHVVGRGLDPRAGLPVAVRLPALVAEVRQGGGAQPVGRDRAGVGDRVAAAAAQLRRDADRPPAPLRILGGGASPCLAPHTPQWSRSTSTGCWPTTSAT